MYYCKMRFFFNMVSPVDLFHKKKNQIFECELDSKIIYRII